MARLELMHNVFCRVFDNRLIFPPVDAPKRVLECGFGAGDWALDVSRTFPDCEVRNAPSIALQATVLAKGHRLCTFQ